MGFEVLEFSFILSWIPMNIFLEFEKTWVRHEENISRYEKNKILRADTVVLK